MTPCHFLKLACWEGKEEGGRKAGEKGGEGSALNSNIWLE
jgi:hypothetical protein